MNILGRQFALVAVASAVAIGGPLTASAQVDAAKGGNCVATLISHAASTGPSAAPLDRRISLRAVDVSLPDALERIAAAGEIRLSYSRELLPANRIACFDATSVPIGDVLAHLLQDSDLEPISAGTAHIVLRRRVRSSPSDSDTRVDSVSHVQELAPVIVTAGTDYSARGDQWGSVTSLDGDELVKRDIRSLRELLEGGLPGIWAWDQPPSAFLTRYGGIRGASSFGASSPKTYIDGVEVANPLLVTMLDPEHIARIDFIRGPQGAALYGADALSGVVNITTRHEGSADGGLDLRVRSSGGVVESRYATSPLLTQSHSLTLRAGSASRSFALALAGDESGSYLPGSSSRQVNALMTGRRIGSQTIVGLTARLASASAASPSVPLLFAADRTTATSSDVITHSSLRQYTLGVTTEILPAGRWRHSFVAGIDGYRLSDPALVAESPLTGPSAFDVPAGSDRVSLRSSSVFRISDNDHTATTLTLGAEHAALRQVSEWTAPAVAPVTASPATTSDVSRDGHGPGPADHRSGRDESAMRGDTPSRAVTSGSLVDWRSNTGVSAQVDMALRQRMFLTGGLRMERLASGIAPARIVALPMLGAGIMGAHDGLTLTLRGAYGKGIRAPRTNQIDLAGPGSRMVLRREGLFPEEQQGTEASAKLAWGRVFSVQVTRFDQLASGLVQRVAIAERRGRQGSEMQNLGEITNRGWELEQSLGAGNFSMSSTLSLIDSRVRTVADGYAGELRPGDRMLEVPALTAGLTVGYTLRRSSASIGLSHARDWIGYDMLALQENSAASGARLRDYWRTYSGVTGLRASVARDLGRGLRLVMTGDNLLDVQRGAPDNATVLPGRTTTLSLRAVF